MLCIDFDDQTINNTDYYHLNSILYILMIVNTLIDQKIVLPRLDSGWANNLLVKDGDRHPKTPPTPGQHVRTGGQFERDTIDRFFF